MTSTPQDRYPQVGIGWAFPPRWASDGTDVVAATSAGEEHVAQAIVILLRTALGERVMRPELGAGVDRYVFESRTPEVCYRLAEDVRRTLLRWEPRIIVEDVAAQPAGEADDRIDVELSYRIDRHRRPTNLIVPFVLRGSS